MRMQKITLNLIPEGDKPIVYASQFDNDRVIRFDLKEGEEDYAYSGTEAFEVAIRKPDDHLVTLEAEKDSEIITVDDEPVTVYFVKVALDENSCACFGESICELKITDGEALIGSLNFVLDVERSPELNGITSTDGVHNLTSQIEDITSQIVGENYYDKEEIDDKFDELNIPTKTSQLDNDSGFVTEEDIPTKTSQLTNDSGFVTEEDIPTKTSQLTNDSGFVTEEDIPTKTSQLTNDSGFTTIDDTVTANYKTWSSNKINEELINILPTGTATGSIANFNTSLALPLVSAKFDVNASGGGGTPSTPIPVDGVSSITVTVADENMQAQETETINLGGTYYGGHFTQDKDGHRQFEVTFGFVDLGTLTYAGSVYGGVQGWYALGISSLIASPLPYGKVHCEIYKQPVSDAIFNSDGIDYEIFIPTNNLLKIKNSDYSDATTFKNDMNGIYAYYELQTPYTIDLPNGVPITTLIGTNNIYVNSGNSKVVYKMSINDAINAAIVSSSNRSLSLMRPSVTEDVIEDSERGDDNEI